MKLSSKKKLITTCKSVSLLFPLLIMASALLSLGQLNRAEAAVVKKVKGKKLLVDTEGEDISQGGYFYLIDENGKKKAIIKITKVRGNRAIAKLGKGKARPGYTLRERRRGQKGRKARRRQDQDPMSSKPRYSSGGMRKIRWGGMFGYAMDSMQVQVNNQSTSMSGSGISLNGVADYNFKPNISLRGLAGYEQFSAKSGDAFCGTTSQETCSADISYINMAVWGRYIFSPSAKYKPWAGGGLALMFPMSKKVTAVDESSVTSTSVFALGGGIDWALNSKAYIPIQIEYGIFPSSDDVKANYIALRFGYIMNF